MIIHNYHVFTQINVVSYYRNTNMQSIDRVFSGAQAMQVYSVCCSVPALCLPSSSLSQLFQ